uniref:Uncharacterized protein n=1 Tax=Octopus bimaculoides TaxID=37653 RepID=A0A0L8H7H0_OCTBM
MPECKRDVKNLYHKLVKLEYAVLTVVWGEVMEHFNKISKKLQTPARDVFEGYLLLTSLLSSVKKLQENSVNRIAHYESVAKGLCEYITSNYSDTYKYIVTKKFADGTRDRASLKEAEKFRIESIRQEDGPIWIQIVKKFKLLSELMTNSEFDEDSIELIILHYKDNIDHKLVNDCYQFNEYLHLRKSWNTEESRSSKIQGIEVL